VRVELGYFWKYSDGDSGIEALIKKDSHRLSAEIWLYLVIQDTSMHAFSPRSGILLSHVGYQCLFKQEH